MVFIAITVSVDLEVQLEYFGLDTLSSIKPSLYYYYYYYMHLSTPMVQEIEK